MKTPIEIIKSLPKEAVEGGSFVLAVLAGSLYKIIRQKQEKGVKITLSKILAETFMSFFTAVVVFAIFDQFLHFNKLFTYMMCSLAGSMSSVFHTNVERAITFLFDAGMDWVRKRSLLLVALTGLMFIGCARKPVKTTEFIEKKDSVVKNETAKTETSKAISDIVYIPIPVIKTIKPECDSITQAALDDALAKLAYQKQSGNNRFELLYDKPNKLLTARANIGETSSTTIAKTDLQKSSDNKDKLTEVPVLFTPWYMKYPAYFGYFCLFLIICWIIRKIYTLWVPKVPSI